MGADVDYFKHGPCVQMLTISNTEHYVCEKIPLTNSRVFNARLELQLVSRHKCLENSKICDDGSKVFSIHLGHGITAGSFDIGEELNFFKDIFMAVIETSKNVFTASNNSLFKCFWVIEIAQNLE